MEQAHTLPAAQLRPWHRIPGCAPVRYAYQITSGQFAGYTMVTFRDGSWLAYPSGHLVTASFGAVVAPASYPDDAPLSAELVSDWEYREYLEMGARNGHSWARAALEVIS